MKWRKMDRRLAAKTDSGPCQSVQTHKHTHTHTMKEEGLIKGINYATAQQ